MHKTLTILNPYTGKFVDVRNVPMKAWYVFTELIHDTHFLRIERFVFHQYTFHQNNSKLFLLNDLLNKQQLNFKEMHTAYEMLVKYGYDLCRAKKEVDIDDHTNSD